jgi:hypothetical protein
VLYGTVYGELAWWEAHPFHSYDNGNEANDDSFDGSLVSSATKPWATGSTFASKPAAYVDCRRNAAVFIFGGSCSSKHAAQNEERCHVPYDSMIVIVPNVVVYK